MSAHRILIVYGTRYGQTAKIAGRMGAVLSRDGFDVTIANAGAIDRVIDPAAFQGILVGGSLIRSKHQRSVRRFVEENRPTINRTPSAFFSVSASAASSDPHGQSDARRAMDAFLTETAWQPDMMTTVGGAIAFTKYSPIVRWVMKRISRGNGGPTDTSRDHELTDWPHVEEFAHAFGRVVAPVAHAGARATSHANAQAEVTPAQS